MLKWPSVRESSQISSLIFEISFDISCTRSSKHYTSYTKNTKYLQCRHCFGILTFIDSCFHLLKWFWWGFQLNRCVKGNYWPLRDNRVHDGKSKRWESFSAINFWCKWRLFSYFCNQKRARLLFCFALSDVIVQGIFCEDELVLWSTVLALRLFVIHWRFYCSFRWPSKHSAVTLNKGRKSGWGWHLVSSLNETRPQTHRSTAILSVFVYPYIAYRSFSVGSKKKLYSCFFKFWFFGW